MDVDYCISFATENPTNFLSTTEGNQPRVRGMLLWFADKTGFYYNTSATKELCAQLKANPKVELCFFNPKSKNLDQMRVTGQAEIIDDLALKQKLLKDRPFLAQMGFGAENPKLIVFRVTKCTAHFWTRDTNLQPKQFISFG